MAGLSYQFKFYIIVLEIIFGSFWYNIITDNNKFYSVRILVRVLFEYTFVYIFIYYFFWCILCVDFVDREKACQCCFWCLICQNNTLFYYNWDYVRTDCRFVGSKMSYRYLTSKLCLRMLYGCSDEKKLNKRTQ